MMFPAVRLSRGLALLCLASLIAACGGGGGDSNSAPAQPETPKPLAGGPQGKPLALKGDVTVLAGTANGSDGIGALARFNAPGGHMIRVGNQLYVAETASHTIRKIDLATRQVTTIAGRYGVTGNADGAGADARFNIPHTLASDGKALFIAENGQLSLRRLDLATGQVTTLNTGDWSNLFSGGMAGMAANETQLYFSDHQAIKRVDIATGKMSVLAGKSYAAGEGYVDAIGTDARFKGIVALALHGNRLYVADYNNSAVRQVDLTTGAVTTVVTKDPIISQPVAVVANDTHVFVQDNSGNVKRFDLASKQSSVLAEGAFASPRALAMGDGTLYVLDDAYTSANVQQVNLTTAEAKIIAGQRAQTDGQGAQAQLESNNIASDGEFLYTVESGGVRKIRIATGEVSTLVSNGAFLYASGITTDGRALYVSVTYGCYLVKVDKVTGEVTHLAGAGGSGTKDGVGRDASFNYPGQLTTDGTHLFVIDGAGTRKVEIATGKVSTLAQPIGAAPTLLSDGRLFSIRGNAVVQADKTTGATTVLAGHLEEAGSADGVGTAARFTGLSTMAIDGSSLYVFDNGIHRVRRIEIATGKVSTLNTAADQLAGIRALANGGNALFALDADGTVIRELR